jgi:hypothetical protein
MKRASHIEEMREEFSRKRVYAPRTQIRHSSASGNDEVI